MHRGKQRMGEIERAEEHAAVSIWKVELKVGEEEAGTKRFVRGMAAEPFREGMMALGKKMNHEAISTSTLKTSRPMFQRASK